MEHCIVFQNNCPVLTFPCTLKAISAHKLCKFFENADSNAELSTMRKRAWVLCTSAHRDWEIKSSTYLTK